MLDAELTDEALTGALLVLFGAQELIVTVCLCDEAEDCEAVECSYGVLLVLRLLSAKNECRKYPAINAKNTAPSRLPFCIFPFLRNRASDFIWTGKFPVQILLLTQMINRRLTK